MEHEGTGGDLCVSDGLSYLDIGWCSGAAELPCARTPPGTEEPLGTLEPLGWFGN